METRKNNHNGLVVCIAFNSPPGMVADLLIPTDVTVLAQDEYAFLLIKHQPSCPYNPEHPKTTSCSCFPDVTFDKCKNDNPVIH